jgi:hypothetical protein
LVRRCSEAISETGGKEEDDLVGHTFRLGRHRAGPLITHTSTKQFSQKKNYQARHNIQLRALSFPASRARITKQPQKERKSRLWTDRESAIHYTILLPELRETPRREKEGVQAATGAEATPTRRGEARRGEGGKRPGMGQALRRLFDAFFSTKEMIVTSPSLPFLVLSGSRRFLKLLDKGVLGSGIGTCFEK